MIKTKQQISDYNKAYYIRTRDIWLPKKNKQSKLYRKRNPKYLANYRKKRLKEDPEYDKKHYQQYREDAIARSCEYAKKNRKKVRKYFQAYYKDPINWQACLDANRKWRQSPQGKAYKAAESAFRRTVKQSKLSKHFRKEIIEIYKNRPKGYHVDHIWPITHPLMTGLHVPWNLQYLPARKNSQKHNHLPT